MRVRVRGPHPLRPGIQPGSPGTWFYATDGRPVGAGKRDPSTPRAQPPTGITRARFGLIRFRSPLLTEYPFLQVLRCFTSLRTPRTRRYRPMTAGGFPHSEILGSKPCWRLPEAYRSLKRPSSGSTSARPRARSWPPPAVRTPPGWNTCISDFFCRTIRRDAYSSDATLRIETLLNVAKSRY